MTNTSQKSVAETQRKLFDLIPQSRHVRIRDITVGEIPAVARFAAAHLPSLKLDDLSIFERIVQFDSTCIQLFEAGGELVGVYAMLFLNRRGELALLDGQFDGTNPCFEHLAARSEKPAAIYTWFVACPGRAVTGFGNVARLLQGGRYARADLYARPASAAGLRLMLGIGYRPVSPDPNGLHQYLRIDLTEVIEQAA
ncbi:MAG TPA: hypothetical protein VK862_02515 [Afifellaceae bacterium]|nr:hypothetical protein [Afifellaceae bacterium]